MNKKAMAFGGPAPAKWTLPRKAALLDISERTFIIALFYPFAANNLVKYIFTHDARALMLVASELLPVFLIALRKISPNMSFSPFDWVVGLFGSGLPLLITLQTDVRPAAPVALCYSLIMMGTFLQIAAKVSLGRSFGIVAANRGVKSQGPYRFVRHPMYAGYFITDIGNLLMIPTTHNAIFYIAALAVQTVRILREEAILCEDVRYRAFARRVRYRLVPGIF